MAYDEQVGERLRRALAGHSNVVERKMFGGISFMVSGHMCCGVAGDDLMARVGPAQYQGALDQLHTREMDFTGRPLRGYVYVAPAGFESDELLQEWVEMCLSFVRTLPPKAYPAEMNT